MGCIQMRSLDDQILSVVYGRGRGSLLTPSEFLRLGSRTAVDKALTRLVAKGRLRRLARGLYDFPRMHLDLGALAPAPEAIAKALAGKDRIRLQPAGAYAANLLRLSEQTPARVVFLTDGPSRKSQVGRQTIELRRTTPRNMAAAGKTAGLVIQALRYLGREHVTPERLRHLRTLLTEADRRELLQYLPTAPAWMHPHLRFIAAGEQSAP